jgi:hypothetical protein
VLVLAFFQPRLRRRILISAPPPNLPRLRRPTCLGSAPQTCLGSAPQTCLGSAAQLASALPPNLLRLRRPTLPRLRRPTCFGSAAQTLPRLRRPTLPRLRRPTCLGSAAQLASAPPPKPCLGSAAGCEARLCLAIVSEKSEGAMPLVRPLALLRAEPEPGA